MFTSDIDSDADGPLGADPRASLEPHIGMRTFSRLFEMCSDPVLILGRDNRLDYDVPGARVASAEGAWVAQERGGVGVAAAEAAAELGAPSLTLP